MTVTESFADVIAKGYATSGPAIELGRGVHDGELVPEAVVQMPLAMMNRHGLVAGATGTGKTRTLQVLAEQLSAAGVPVVRRRHQGRPVGPRRRRGRRRPGAEARRRTRGAPSRRRRSRSSTWRSAASAPASRCARRCRTSARSCSPRCSARTRRRSRASAWSSATPTSKGSPLLDLADLRALLTYLESDDGKAELTGIGGALLADGRRAAARARQARGRRRQRVLRRAAVRDRRPDAHSRPTAAGSSRASSWPPCRTSRSSSRPC